MRIIAFLTEAPSIRQVLQHLGRHLYRPGLDDYWRLDPIAYLLIYGNPGADCNFQ